MNSSRSTLIYSLLVCLLSSCYHYEEASRYQHAYVNSASLPTSTIVIKLEECTECSDAILVKGSFKTPDTMQDSLPHRVYTDSSTVDIKLTGKFPVELLDPTSLLHRQGALYKITGRVVSVYNDGNTGEPLPVFYVEKWEN